MKSKIIQRIIRLFHLSCKNIFKRDSMSVFYFKNNHLGTTEQEIVFEVKEHTSHIQSSIEIFFDLTQYLF